MCVLWVSEVYWLELLPPAGLVSVSEPGLEWVRHGWLDTEVSRTEVTDLTCDTASMIGTHATHIQTHSPPPALSQLSAYYQNTPKTHSSAVCHDYFTVLEIFEKVSFLFAFSWKSFMFTNVLRRHWELLTNCLLSFSSLTLTSVGAGCLRSLSQ